MNTMTEKVCLVTGGTSGVGRSIAEACAREGATVVIVSRDKVRGDLVAAELSGETGNARIEALTADMGSLASVRKLAEAFLRKHARVHLLSLNAATLTMDRTVTPDGYESIFATNYLGHFALTRHLQGALRASRPARVIAVSGTPGSIKRIRLDMDDLMLNKGWNPLKATLRAAVAKALFMFELARRMEGAGVTANTFHPGIVRSNLPKSLPWYLGVPAGLAMSFVGRVSRTGVYLAIAPEAEGLTGSFFVSGRPAEFRPPYDLVQEAARLWEASERLMGSAP